MMKLFLHNMREEKPKSEGSQTEGNFPDLSTAEFVKHSAYREAMRSLKEGQIKEHDFLAMLTRKQGQGLFKAMEYKRTPAMTAGWSQIDGKGSTKRKQDMRLSYFKDGLKESHRYKETKVGTRKELKKRYGMGLLKKDNRRIWRRRGQGKSEGRSDFDEKRP